MPRKKTAKPQSKKTQKKKDEVSETISEQKEMKTEEKKEEKQESLTIMGVVSESSMGGYKAKIMKESLMRQPRVTIMIPLEGNEKMGSSYPVTLNGYRLNITKGIYVKVPKQVAEVVMESQNMTQQAINNYFAMDAMGVSQAMRDKGLGPQ